MQYPIEMGWMKRLIGYSRSDVGVDISGDVRLLPDGSSFMPWQYQHAYPGAQKKDFSFPMDAPLTLQVKAGTSGTIEVRLFIDYQFFLPDKVPFMPSLPVSVPDWLDPTIGKFPDKKTGSVHCHGTWNYSSTRLGNLKLEYVTADLSPVSDGFSVRVDRAPVQAGPTKGQVQLIPRFDYAGPYTTASVTPIHPTVFLNLTDIEQPKPPVPPVSPVPGKALEHTVYFLFDERNHLSPKNNNLKNFINSEDQLKSLRIFMESIKSGVGLKNIQRVEVHGYASAPGTTEYNDKLSADRAENIAAWLRTNYHAEIPPGAIWPHGERTNSTNEKDVPSERRVDVNITLKAGSKP